MFELSTALPAASIIASRFACAAAPAPFDVPNATATSEAEMKPYAEVIEHAPQTIEMIPIRGGKFLMGSPASEPSRRKDEGPQHEVEVGRSGWPKHEMTWDGGLVYSASVTPEPSRC